MSEVSDRYRKLTDQFLDRARQVAPEAWDQPSPCEKWSARDVVRHLVETTEFFVGRAGVDVSGLPSVDDDPVAAFEAARSVTLAALEDPEVATKPYETPMGQMTMEQTISRFGVGDVLVHTWDVARATGLDETIDAEEATRLLASLEPMDEMMRQSGSFGPRMEVGDDADAQTRLLAFTGRDPSR